MVPASPCWRTKRIGIGMSFLIGIAGLMGAPRADASVWQTLHRHRASILSQLKPIGPLDKTQELNLAISLPLRNQAGLTQLLQQISDPTSPNYRHYLTPAQFTAQFGPTQSDYQAVIAFAKANGLTVTARHANRMIVDVKGTVPVVEKALHVTMLSYQHPTEKRKFFAPDADAMLNLSVQVLGISGLDNYELPQPRYKRRAATAAASQSGTTTGMSTAASAPDSGSPTASPNVGTGTSGSYMGSDFRTAYVPGVALTGSGQTVGLLQFDGYTASDITYYETKANLPAVPLTNILLDGFSGAPTGKGGEVEVSLDIEMSMSIAPGLAGIIVYEAGPSGNWHDVLNRMANDNLAKQLSCSWFIPGGVMDTTADQIFQQMAAQGQSFFTASGDYDAFTGLIPFPGDTPYATEVGGTMLTTATAGGAYSSEQVWNRNNGIGTGGGISTQYAIPSWQQGISMTANLGSTTMRNVPDVALTAENVYVRADGSDQLVGGTSCAAPLWAGFIALVNQQAMVNTGTTVGFINPAVYAIGQGSGYATDFHDTTTGNNFSSSSPSKFPGTTGYDLCTGWGTPNGAALINALAPTSIPVIINTSPLPSSSAGVAYNETLTATGGTPGYTFSIVSGSLPNGLNLSSGGAISGTTNVSGTTANFTVQVTDSKGKSSSTALAITCLSAGSPVITTISPLPIGSTALAYSLTFAAAGGTPPYTYSPGTGTFPPGLTLSTAGVLSGAPSATGTYTFYVNLADNIGANSNVPFTMTVGSPPTFISGPTLATGIVNSPYTQSIGATGGKVPYAWSVTSGALPAGLTMNSAGVITGTPTSAGTANFTVNVAGTDGLSSSQAFSLTIQAYGSLDHFIWGAIGSPQTAGTPFTATITAKDSVNNTVTGFTGTTTLTSGSPHTILNTPTFTASGNNGTWTLGYSFTPSSPITVTGVRSYSGSKVSIWTDSGVLLASTTVSGTNGVWTDTPITPVQLLSGVTYRVSFLTGGQTYYWNSSLSSTFANGTINQDYYSSGDAFPTTIDSERWWFVDLKYTVGSTVPVSPGTTGAFTAGAWNGSLSISQTGTGVVLEANDGSGHIGDSNSFNVTTLANISVTPASGFTSAGGTGGPFTPSSASYQVTNTGSGSMSWSANGAPAWITLSPASGTLASGASTTVTASINTAANSFGVGTYTGTINFNNTTSGFGNTSRSVSLTVTPPPPVITSSLTASGSAGQLFSYQITASNSPTSFGATGLPTGLGINSSGLISGTPAAAGISNITISATNANGTGSATLVLTIQQAPTFTNAPLSVPIAIGSAYNFSFTTTGSPTPTFAVTAGGLPTGLSLSSTGAITGTATQLGTYSGTVTATNSAGSASQNFTFTVVSGLTFGITLPATVNEDDPDGQGTLSISAVSSSPITVTLASSNIGALTVPATVTVPANQSSVPLPYTIIDNLSVYGTQTTTVSASAAGWTGASQLVTVTDNKTLASWNTFGNGQAHTGVYRGSLLGITYAQAWATTFSRALNPVAVDKGLVYVTLNAYSGTADLNVVSATTGALVWSRSFASTGESGYAVNPPTVYKGNVYVQQGTGIPNGGGQVIPPVLWSNNATTGQTNWTAPFTAQWESYFAPTIYQSAGIWVDGGTYGGLYGFNFNGSQSAFVTEPQYDLWTPTYYNGVIYSYVAGSFKAVNPSTGVVSWSLSLTDSSTPYSMNCAMPIANNLAYANGHLYLNAVNVATHAVAWTVSGTFTGTPAVANGNIYVISGSQVEVLNASTGASITAYQTGNTGLTGQPVVASDSLVVSSSTRTYLFDLGTGTLVQTIPYGGPVSVANGTLYIAGSDGYLRAFQPGTSVAPTFSPVAGTYTSAQSVALSSTTSGGASIAYTTDGSTPTESGGSVTHGTLYSTPIAINGTTTINAIAFKAGLADSAVATAVYHINISGVEAAPTFSPGGGTYTSAQSVTLTSATSGASIAYTTDGSTPTESGGSIAHGTLYTTPISIGTATTLKAIAFDASQVNTDSTVSTAAYTLQAAAPAFSQAGGTYTSAQSVTLTSATSGASINYTTDGSTPTETHGTPYTGPVSISATTTLSAIAFKTGFSDSTIVTAIYTLQAAAPAFSQAGGTYTSAQSVTLTSATSGASINYTTDGSTPTETHGTPYSGSINITATTILNAIAFESGFSDSTVVTAVYTLQATTPAFSPAGGTYTSAQSVTLTSATSGASINYTTDGSTPTETHGTLYTGPVSISTTTTLSAIAFKTGYIDSGVSIAGYTINLPPVTPTFSPAAGTYASAQSVTITSASGATIRYTTDGSTPTETNGTIYSGPVSITKTTILKAIAYKSGYPDTSVASGIYTITSSPAAILNVIYNFTSSGNGGFYPYAGLVQGTDGNLYGTANEGGSSNAGTVFKITPTGSLTALTSFTGSNGGYPFAGLVQSTDGNFYGTTNTPLFNPSLTYPGTAFKITPTGTLTTLVTFSSANGIFPFAGLIQGTDGNFYGATFEAGSGSYGTLFKMTPTGGLTTLVSFAGANGGLPNANLVQGSDGNFYGMTYEGGSTYVSINNLGEGTIFRMTPAGALTTLVSFTGANGSYPAANLVQGIDGNFYGTTTEDNVNDDGTVFKMTPAGVLTTLVYFSSISGQYPNGLVQGSDGNFYGTTEGTGSGGKDGTVFKITPAGALTTLASFDSANGNEPLAGLVQGTDGNFYGTTVLGGSSNVGVIFQLIVPSCTAAPVFSPAPGTYTGAQTVTITSATSGASIRYTMNGSTPTETTGTLYSGPVNISSTTTLNAIAFKTGMADSAVITPAYTIQSATSSSGGSSSSSAASSDGGGGGGGGAFDDWFLGFLAVVGIWQWKRRKT